MKQPKTGVSTDEIPKNLTPEEVCEFIAKKCAERSKKHDEYLRWLEAHPVQKFIAGSYMTIIGDVTLIWAFLFALAFFGHPLDPNEIPWGIIQ